MLQLISAESVFLQEALGESHSDFQDEGAEYVQHCALCSVLQSCCWCGLGLQETM